MEKNRVYINGIKKMMLFFVISGFIAYVVMQSVWVLSQKIRTENLKLEQSFVNVEKDFRNTISIILKTLMPSHDYMIQGDRISAVKEQKQLEEKLGMAFDKTIESINNVPVLPVFSKEDKNVLVKNLDSLKILVDGIIEIENGILQGKYTNNMVAMEEIDAKSQIYEKYVNKVLQEMTNNGDSIKKKIDKINGMLAWVQFGLFTLIIMIIMVFAIIFYRKLKKEIEQMLSVIKKTEKMNDFSHRIKEVHIEELAIISSGFNALLDALYMTYNKISDLSIYLLQSSENTATSMEEISATLEEINASMEDIAHRVEKLKETTDKVIKGVYKEQDIVQSVYESMMSLKSVSDGFSQESKSVQENTNKVFDSFNDVEHFFGITENKFEEIISKTEEIMNIVKKIEDINNKINILSLNARIEAAKVKDVGGGFGVIAGEIKNLANKSQDALVTIEDFYGSLKQELRDLLSAMGDVAEGMNVLKKGVESMKDVVFESIKEMEDVGSISQKTATDMNKLNDISNSIKNEMSGIPDSMEEVLMNTQQIAGGIEEISAQMQELTANTEEIAEKAMDLRKMMEEDKEKE